MEDRHIKEGPQGSECALIFLFNIIKQWVENVNECTAKALIEDAGSEG